jgi:hypothetical protein
MFAGLLVIILGIAKQLKGNYSIGVNIKTQLPVVRTGLYLALIGAAIFLAGFLPIFKIQKNRKFYSELGM